MIEKIKKHKWLLLVLTLGLIVRISLNNVLYSKDAESFVFWGYYLKDHSIASLYENLPGGFTPLPPLYYYITRIIVKLIEFFSLWQNEWLTYLIFKIPPITSEVITAVLIYRLVAKYLNKKAANLSAAFYFLHPAIIYNTAVFGQIDSFVSSMAFFAAILLISRRYFIGLVIYTIGVLSKLQDLAVLPLVVLLSTVNVSFRKLIFMLVTTGFLVLLPILPVIFGKDFSWTVQYFLQLPNWYPYTSIYTYNIWSFAGFLTPDSTKLFSLISYRFLGLFLYWVIAFIIVAPLLKKDNRKPLTILFAAFLLFFDFAFFSTRIHSRYLIYSLPFVSPFLSLFRYEITAFSLLMILNLALPLNYKNTEFFVSFLNQKSIIILISFIAMILFFSFYRKYRGMLKV